MGGGNTGKDLKAMRRVKSGALHEYYDVTTVLCANVALTIPLNEELISSECPIDGINCHLMPLPRLLIKNSW